MSKIDTIRIIIVLVFTNETFFIKKFFSWTCTIKHKSDVQITSDDSYMPYNSQVDIILIKVVLVLVYEKLIVKNFFENLQSEEKIDVHLTFDHSKQTRFLLMKQLLFETFFWMM